MPPRFLRPALLVWMIWLSAAASAAPLTLTCEIKGESYPIAKVERSRVLVQKDGRLIPVPSNAKWHLEGDLRENARFVEWSPICGVSQLDLPDCKIGTTPARMEANVGMLHRSEWANRPFESPFLKRWPEGLSTPGLIVMAWVLDGQVIAMDVDPVPASTRAKEFRTSARLKLTPAEALGQPVVLVWHEGAFAPAAPRFAAPEAQAAFWAVENNDLAALQAALHAGVRARVRDDDGYSLLYYASEAGHLGMVDALLAVGVKPGVNRRKAKSVLLGAVGSGREAVVDRLLLAGADPDEGVADQRPLVMAMHRRLSGIALRLIAAKAAVNEADDTGRRPLLVALDEGLVNVANALMAKKAAQESDKDQAARALITQAKKGHTASVRWLLKDGVKPDVEFRGGTALIVGADSGDPELAKALIAAGASPNQAIASGLTPLMAAARAGEDGYAKALLDAGADANAASDDGRTALHFAAGARADSLVDLLLARGAKADVADKHGVTPLQLALQSGIRGAANALVTKGAALDLHAASAPECMEIAIAINAEEVVRMALAAGWPADTVFQGGWPALRVAVETEATECAGLLRAAGVGTETGGPVLIRASKLDKKLVVARAVQPKDPRDLDADFDAETIEVDVVVDPTGDVRFPRIVGSPDPVLVTATLQAIRQWKFSVPSSGGEVVACRVRVPVIFAASKDIAHELFDVDRTPQAVKTVSPIYPMDLRRKGITGEVRLRFIVKADGHVGYIRVKSSSYPSLDEAASLAVAQWIFRPAELEDKPVDVWVEQPVIFSFNN